MNINSEDVLNVKAGEVFKYNGKNYKLLKKTTTAVSVSRYYWFDKIGDYISQRMMQW